MKPVILLPSLHAAAAVLVCASLACGGGPKGEPASTSPASMAETPPSAADVATASTPAEDAVADSTGPEGAEGATGALKPPPFTPFGLPECDGFLRKYLACVEERVPADQRGRFEAELRDNRTRWWKLADMQQGLVAVGLACRIFAQSKKGDLAVDYGCEF